MAPPITPRRTVEKEMAMDEALFLPLLPEPPPLPPLPFEPLLPVVCALPGAVFVTPPPPVAAPVFVGPAAAAEMWTELTGCPNSEQADTMAVCDR